MGGAEQVEVRSGFVMLGVVVTLTTSKAHKLTAI